MWTNNERLWNTWFCESWASWNFVKQAYFVIPEHSSTSRDITLIYVHRHCFYLSCQSHKLDETCCMFVIYLKLQVTSTNPHYCFWAEYTFLLSCTQGIVLLFMFLGVWGRPWTGWLVCVSIINMFRGIFVYYLSNIYKISNVAQKHVDAQRRFSKTIAFVSTCSSIYIYTYMGFLSKWHKSSSVYIEDIACLC